MLNWDGLSRSTHWYFLPPLFVALSALIAGILASPYLDNRFVWMTFPLALAVAFARPRFALVPVLLFGSGIRAFEETEPPYIEDDGLPVRVTAVLDNAPESRAPGYYLTVRLIRVGDAAVKGRARLTYFPPDDSEKLTELFDDLGLGSGDRIEVLVRLRRPGVYRNAGGFDYRQFLERRGIYWTGSIRNPRLIQVVSRGWHGPDRLRRWASRRIEERLSADDTIEALALGMVLGHRRRLPAAAERQFEAAGLIHLLVVSGFNLAIVAAAALWLGRRVRFGRRGRTWSLILALGVVLTYAFLVEGDAPVIRATLMATFLIVGMLLDRGYAVGNALSAAGIAILALDPMTLFDMGFQLTFAAVLAILLLGMPLIRWGLGGWIATLRHLDIPSLDGNLPVETADWRVSKRLESELANRPLWVSAFPIRLTIFLAEAAIVTTAVQFVLLPWSIESYHRLSPVALPLNVLGAVVAGVVTPMGLLLMLVPDFLAGPIAAIVVVSLKVLVTAVEWSLEFSGATFRVPSPPAAWWLGFAFLLVATTLAVRYRQKGRLIVVAAGTFLLLALLGTGDFSPPAPEHATLTFLDVGQGDAALVELPDGKRYMIDGGGISSGGYRSLRNEGGFSIGEDVLTPYLLSRGIRHLDAVVLTHAHHDHMDGLFELIGNFNVGELWLGTNPVTPRYRELLEHASAHAVPIRWLMAGDSVGAFTVLNPPETRQAGRRVANDDSVVLLLETPGGTALLTGDLESDLSAAPPHVTVLKVPHHGSRNSVLRTSSDLPVISVGANNSFGHPHESKLPALRTDIVGSIRVILDPDGLEVTFPGL